MSKVNAWNKKWSLMENSRSVDAMTEAERHAAAMADPDARPMTDEEWARARRVPQVSVIRRALKLSQQQFAATFHIPIGTVRDYEELAFVRETLTKCLTWNHELEQALAKIRQE